MTLPNVFLHKPCSPSSSSKMKTKLLIVPAATSASPHPVAGKPNDGRGYPSAWTLLHRAGQAATLPSLAINNTTRQDAQTNYILCNNPSFPHLSSITSTRQSGTSPSSIRPLLASTQSSLGLFHVLPLLAAYHCPPLEARHAHLDPPQHLLRTTHPTLELHTPHPFTSSIHVGCYSVATKVFL